MAEPLQPCCERAREMFLKRLTKAIVSYPVIKSFPCPACKRIVQIRIYTPPEQAGESVENSR